MSTTDGSREYARTLSPESYCYLVDLNNSTRVHFQLMPDPVSETKNAIYNEVPIIGRSLPQLGYHSSSSRVVALELNFVALEREGKYTTKWVKEQVRWLEAKTYPRYMNGFTFPPPKMLLIMADVIGLQCIMTTCTTNWSGPWDVNESNKAQAFRASVNIQLQEVGQNAGAWGHPFGHGQAVTSSNQASYGYAGESYVEIPLSDQI